MLQVLQHQKTGELHIAEIPAPTCKPEGVLVRTVASLISAGTERTSITNAQSSLIERAKKQPDQVAQVIDMVKKEGLIYTYNKVRGALDAYKTLGYSTAGIVVESRCDEFLVGDRVACAGAQFAHHAEYVSVPKNLVSRIPEGVSFDDACYTTLGAIALQGVRQADVRLGETVVVVGLGLLGMLTIQLLKASGCVVIGMDINPSLFQRAKDYGCAATLESSDSSVSSVVAQSKGYGADAVIITASTSSSEPINMAMKMLRKKGTLIVVGAIGMDIQRSPFYEKEINVKISCSYGPGRYDPSYEDAGIDYPIGYVRWTENRNMQSFLEGIQAQWLDVASMTTHTFPIEAAQQAYDLVTGKDIEPSLGIVLHYPEREGGLQRFVQLKKFTPQSDVGLGLIGAGAFAQSSLLPPLKANNVQMVAVSTATSANALSVGNHFGFSQTSTQASEVLNNPNTNLIVCASRHDSHGAYVVQALNAGKPIFVEKPLCINKEQLDAIDEAVKRTNGRVMVGFNRRFSAPIRQLKTNFSERTDPMHITYRMNAGFIPKTSWMQDSSQGGRIIGEVCHAIDCMVFLTDAIPLTINSESIRGNNTSLRNHDVVSITITFSDGSVGVVHYLGNGDGSLGKEYCEVFCENSVAIMDNFTKVTLHRGKTMTSKSYNGGKGHPEEIAAVVTSVRNGQAFPIQYSHLRAVTLATFAAVESLSTGKKIFLDEQL